MSVLRKLCICACLPISPGVRGSYSRLPLGNFKYLHALRYKNINVSSKLTCDETLSMCATNCFVPETKSYSTNTGNTSAGSSLFHDMLKFRQNQAKCSVIIQISSKKDIPYALDLCKNFGDVTKMIVFINDKNILQVITEFAHEGSVEKLLSQSRVKNITEVFPFYSRCLYFENSKNHKHSATSLSTIVADLSVDDISECTNSSTTVSEMIVDLYEKEKMSDLSIRLRFLACITLEDTLKGIFPYCTAFPFGSSVNGFGKVNSDLDLMLRLFSEQDKGDSGLYFQAKTVEGDNRLLQRRAVFVLGDILQTFSPGISNVRRILNARVPIVKYDFQLLNLECDISVNNMSAIYMSEVLFFCGELDPRVRPLVCVLKKWAREANVTYEFPGSWITNFSLTLLVIYFLQTRPIPILPPLDELVKLPSHDDYRTYGVEYLNKEGASSLKMAAAGKNTESLATLLEEFFNFLIVFPFKDKTISILSATTCPRKDDYCMSVCYPFDETKNVTKNISQHELQHICRAASAGSKNLAKCSRTDIKNTQLMSLLGITGTGKRDPDKIDIRTFLDESPNTKKAAKSINLI